MEYEVYREPGGWEIREKGQLTHGTTVTDSWLETMGFGAPSRLNIEAIVQATYALAGGAILDPYSARRRPRDLAFTPSSRSYPATPSTGRLRKNPPEKRERPRPRIPARMLFRA